MAVNRAHAALKPWHLLILIAGLTAAFRIALPMPRTLTADEVDTLRGGHRLVDVMTAASTDGRLGGDGTKARLLKGFETVSDHPRLQLVGDNPSRRAVLEAPLPRWLSALGIGVLPVSSDMTNLERSANASALAVSAALAVLLWTFRHRGRVLLVALGVVYLGLPPVWEAAASAGYAASGLLAGALFIAALERLLRPAALHHEVDGDPLARRQDVAGWAMAGRQNLNSLLVGFGLGLCLGVHPFSIGLAVAVFIVWAIKVNPGSGSMNSPHDQLRLPSAPLGLFLVPMVALVTLIVLWPSLWVGTGKRLGAYLLDAGTLPSAVHTVVGTVYDQANQRSSQAWTALLQWVSWTPLPLMALWGIGLAGTIRARRAGAWTGPVMLGMLLLAGCLDGSLFGGRLSILPLVLAPTVLTAAFGLEYLVEVLRDTRPRLLAVLAIALLVPFVQVFRGSTFGLARNTGAELRHPIPTGLLQTLEALEPGASIGVLQDSACLPALDAALVDLEFDLDPTQENPRYVIVHGATDAPSLVREIARDGRSGVRVSLWETVPR